VAIVNSITDTLKKTSLRERERERGQTEPGLVAFYDIRPGNGAGLFFRPGPARAVVKVVL